MLEGDAETPTRMVGAKKVPILEKEDGSHMPESMDIVRYLEEQNPPAKLTAPDDSVIEEWLGAHSQAIFELSVPERFAYTILKILTICVLTLFNHRRIEFQLCQ